MSGSKEDSRRASSDWRDFFWNPRTHELLGRTGTSWGLVLLFYLIFYLFLAGLFALTMYILLLTLDDYKPTWQDQLDTPGMMIRPKGDQLEIRFSVSDPESWNGFVQNLNSFLTSYNDSHQVQLNDACSPDQYFIQEDSGEVIGMLPGKDGQSPYVTCGAKKEDREKMGPLTYFPVNATFNLMYYPYYGKKAQVNYTQPLVAVKFLNASLNTDINVECKVTSNTLMAGSERDKFAGRVSFKLRIDGQEDQ
ncbi:sodium/potassium-transporting ATPase subunit beta-2-like isoform X2 [Xiphophorus hellerii]|uniref:sodium/potassium-transporting ATPase subunit beta-2-like isoform X2 n=1 Tax=Xiphophorus hellerii TaxID=8084 RepID=UPI0013B40A39|nr:sodium/potassium-transporting ATPase subunit beta-2-like isoform X2 [Xiphophorus hellerii]